jgi:hypothetical protein
MLSKTHIDNLFASAGRERTVMLLIVAIIPSIVVLLVLHLAVFKHKIKWLNWTALVLSCGGMVALLGFGLLHAGLIGLLTFGLGFLWLWIYHRIAKPSTGASATKANRTASQAPVA